VGGFLFGDFVAVFCFRINPPLRIDLPTGETGLIESYNNLGGFMNLRLLLLFQSPNQNRQYQQRRKQRAYFNKYGELVGFNNKNKWSINEDPCRGYSGYPRISLSSRPGAIADFNQYIYYYNNNEIVSETCQKNQENIQRYLAAEQADDRIIGR
jgi:hypothetical protein